MAIQWTLSEATLTVLPETSLCYLILGNSTA